MKISITLGLMLLALCLPIGQAAGVAGTATDSIRTMLDEVMAIQNDPGLQGQESRSARRELIRKVILKNFDFGVMAKDALGPEQWNGLSAGQRSEFKSIFQDLFLDSYSRLVLDFLKKEKIEYRGQEADHGMATVRTVIRRLDDRIPVDYSAGQQDGSDAWSVRDVTIDGVSIVQNYRKSFSRVIKEESYNGLMKRLRLQREAARGEEQKAKP